jgi:hypothetical protein
MAGLGCAAIRITEQQTMKKILIFLSALALAGCIGDDPDDSGGLCRELVEIGLRYKFDDGVGRSSLADAMIAANIYIFDAHTGMLLQTLPLSAPQITSGSVTVELHPGDYTFVAWGTSAENLTRGGFGVAGYTLNNLRLALLDPRIFGELYHAVAYGVTVTKGQSAEVQLDFSCHTNLLQVKVKGVPATRADGPTEVYVTGKQGLYAHDGSIHPDTERDTFPSSNPGHDGTGATCDVHLMRLHRDFHASNPVLLHVERDGEPLYEPQDIVELLKMAGYDSQDDFDRNYLHTIEIGTDQVTLKVTVTINGYTIVYPQPEKKKL